MVPLCGIENGAMYVSFSVFINCNLNHSDRDQTSGNRPLPHTHTCAHSAFLYLFIPNPTSDQRLQRRLDCGKYCRYSLACSFNKMICCWNNWQNHSWRLYIFTSCNLLEYFTCYFVFCSNSEAVLCPFIIKNSFEVLKRSTYKILFG